MEKGEELAFVASRFEQLVELAKIAAAEPVVVAHEDLQSIAGGCEAQGCSEHRCERDAHVDSALQRRQSNRAQYDQSIAIEGVLRSCNAIPQLLYTHCTSRYSNPCIFNRHHDDSL